MMEFTTKKPVAFTTSPISRRRMSRIKTFVHLRGDGDAALGNIEISVGEGTQTLKWLAMAVENRIKQYKLLRKVFSQDNVVVVGIQNENGELIDPADKICEHCLGERIDLKVHVKEQVAVTCMTDPYFPTTPALLITIMYTQIPSDEHGTPMFTDWMAEAFIRSESGVKWHTESNAW